MPSLHVFTNFVKIKSRRPASSRSFSKMNDRMWKQGDGRCYQSGGQLRRTVTFLLLWWGEPRQGAAPQTRKALERYTKKCSPFQRCQVWKLFIVTNVYICVPKLVTFRHPVALTKSPIAARVDIYVSSRLCCLDTILYYSMYANPSSFFLCCSPSE